MPLDKDAMAAMRPGILSLAVACGVSILLLGGVGYLNFSHARDFAAAEAKFKQTLNRQQKAQRDSETVRDYLPRYQQLVRRGLFVAEEPRLQWIETLRSSSDRLRAPSIQYKILPQHAYAPDFLPINGGYEIRASDMQITMQTLHEGDLFSVLTTLDQKAPGLFHITECNLDRLTEHTHTDAQMANVAIDCSLRWFTIKFNNQQGEVDAS